MSKDDDPPILSPMSSSYSFLTSSSSVYSDFPPLLTSEVKRQHEIFWKHGACLPSSISPELEEAYIRFCRFSRNLVLRNDKILTSTDYRMFCGDYLLRDARATLKAFKDNVVDSVYYLYNHDTTYHWHRNRFNRKRLELFTTFVTKNGPRFDSSFKKFLGFGRHEKNSINYSMEYFDVWKKSFRGVQALTTFYSKMPGLLIRTNKDVGNSKVPYQPTEIFIPCPYCKNGLYLSGREGSEIMCDSCSEFFNFVNSIRSVCKTKSIYLSPTVFKWNKIVCYEPTIPQRKTLSRIRKRTRSLTTEKEVCWDRAEAADFHKLLRRLRAAKARSKRH